MTSFYFSMRYLAAVVFPLSPRECSSEDVPSVSCAEVQERREVSELLPKDYSCVFAGDKPVIVDVGATWCRPCNAMRPHIEAFQELYPEVRVVRVTTDKNPKHEALLEKIHAGDIDAIPTLLFFSSSHMLASVRGARPLSNIILTTEKILPLPKKDPEALKERVTGNYLLQKRLSDDVLYLKDFTLDDVVELTACDLPPVVANPYGAKFLGESICWMHANGYSADFVAQYDAAYTGKQVMVFIFAKVPPEEANKKPHQ